MILVIISRQSLKEKIQKENIYRHAIVIASVADICSTFSNWGDFGSSQIQLSNFNSLLLCTN